MTHKIVTIPKRTGRAGFPDVQQLLQHCPRAVVALALAAIVALLGVLGRPSPPTLSTVVTGNAALAARARPLGADHSFVAASTTFVIAALLINWVMMPMLIWLIAVALLAGGVAGAALRWPELAWFSGTRPIWRAIRVGATLVGCALIVTVAVI